MEAAFVWDTYATDLGGAQLARLTSMLIDRVQAYPNPDCLRIETLLELGPILESLRSWRPDLSIRT